MELLRLGAVTLCDLVQAETWFVDGALCARSSRVRASSLGRVRETIVSSRLRNCARAELNHFGTEIIIRG